jgi:hypothetical protein
MLRTYEYTVIAGADKVISSEDMNTRTFKYHERNLQVSVEGLGGGTYSVFYRVPNGSTFIEHVSNATDQDCVVLAGKGSPIISTLKITFNNTVGNQKILLSTWERGI